MVGKNRNGVSVTPGHGQTGSDTGALISSTLFTLPVSWASCLWFKKKKHHFITQRL